jgi:hypothetical protein
MSASVDQGAAVAHTFPSSPRVTASHLAKLATELVAETVLSTALEPYAAEVRRNGALLYIRMIRAELDELEAMLSPPAAEAA